MPNTLALIQDALAEPRRRPEYVFVGDREWLEIAEHLVTEPGGHVTYHGVPIIGVDREFFLRVTYKGQ